jgi:SdrD B-like domain/Protein of unknown function (DUF3048) C-terminal domain
MKKAQPFPLVLILTSAVLLNSCGPASVAISGPITDQSNPRTAQPITITTDAPANTPTTTSVAQAIPIPATLGPKQTDFPSGYNPLTGQKVTDPSLLDIPAVLVSVSHFPPTARPQSGLSFAPYVFEFSITTGESRFLATFYGESPAPEIPVTGGCTIRNEPFKQTSLILGNRVWFDSNQNGIQDPGEGGVAGVCVNLFDASGTLLQTTTTDSNGYFGFNVQARQTYRIGFIKPQSLDFTKLNAGDPASDSNADPTTGTTQPITPTQDDLSWDAGLIPMAGSAAATPDPKIAPAPELGPVRSGRLLYSYIASSFTDSCLIDAFASPEVLDKIPHCAFVTHEVNGGGQMISIQRFNATALDNQEMAVHAFDYASNIFAQQPPSGGVPAQQLNVFYSFLNQSGYSYDSLYQAYLRFVDDADKKTAGILHADVDRLTGRQLHFENVIVVMADTDVISPTNLDIHLDQGNDGYAFLFRDGLMYKIRWSTRAGDYERQTGLRHPMQFVNMDGSLAALKPGHTWVVIVTPFSLFQQQPNGDFLVRYAAPQGELR